MRLRLIFSSAGRLSLFAASFWIGCTDGALARDGIAGRWLTPDGEGVIEIAPCAAAYCGRIVGMDETTDKDGQPSRGTDGQPQCGLTILRLTGRDAEGVWSGTILDPNSGSTWTCEVWRDADGVHLRGYILTPLLGRTQLWTAYAAPLPPNCAMPR